MVRDYRRHSRIWAASASVLVCSGLLVSSAFASAKTELSNLLRVAVGPISAIDHDVGSVDVLGQRFELTYGTSQQGWGDGEVFAVGDYVVVIGAALDQTAQAAFVGLLSEQYVPGASPVFLRATLDHVDPTAAVAAVGSIRVDYSATLYEPVGAVRSGGVVEFLGTQPMVGGTVLASAKRIDLGSFASGSELLSITGSDRAGLSITGSDRARLSITGSDRAGLSITGSDRARLSITGSDRAGLSITGSDRAGLSITGSDRAGLSITGSDSLGSRLQ
jgi:hypothetical protein